MGGECWPRGELLDLVVLNDVVVVVFGVKRFVCLIDVLRVFVLPSFAPIYGHIFNVFLLGCSSSSTLALSPPPRVFCFFPYRITLLCLALLMGYIQDLGEDSSPTRRNIVSRLRIARIVVWEMK